MPVDRSVVDPEQEPKPLDELAARVRDSHEAFQAASANALALALDAGDDLFALQRALRAHEIGWEAWLRDWGHVKLSTARLCMQLARHRDEIEAARAQVPELSLRAARRLIGSKQDRVSNNSQPATAQDEPPATATTMVATAAGVPPGSDSSGEVTCLRARTQELERELEEARAAQEEEDPDLALNAALDNVTFEQCFQAISSYSQSWRDALERRVIEDFSVEQLLALLEDKIVHTAKTRAAFKEIRKALRRPQLELVANSAARLKNQG